jgi:hypothetical protein
MPTTLEAITDRMPRAQFNGQYFVGIRGVGIGVEIPDRNPDIGNPSEITQRKSTRLSMSSIRT